MKVAFYRKTSGRSPVEEYLDGLPEKEQGQIFEVLRQIGNYGLDAIGARFRQVEGKLWELKIFSHRLFYVLPTREKMVLLNAYRKQGRKMPLHERETAYQRMREVIE